MHVIRHVLVRLTHLTGAVCPHLVRCVTGALLRRRCPPVLDRPSRVRPGPGRVGPVGSAPVGARLVQEAGRTISARCRATGVREAEWDYGDVGRRWCGGASPQWLLLSPVSPGTQPGTIHRSPEATTPRFNLRDGTSGAYCGGTKTSASSEGWVIPPAAERTDGRTKTPQPQPQKARLSRHQSYYTL